MELWTELEHKQKHGHGHIHTGEYTTNSKGRKGNWLGVSHNVGDKLIYFIYCSDTNKVVSRSIIRSEDPLKGGIVNKCLH